VREGVVDAIVGEVDDAAHTQRGDLRSETTNVGELTDGED